ncbi:ParB/RepB/Spo0J family partition protein [Patescibacteria group bacterium]|nr:ParB/RepB/Spo0J family partition protein [Patescibacteria group bacterium]MBU4082793.1 ParB/RepB/Spo0J family partition protein [Patescibacteria group bacterium]MCG2809326.1 ParB/RepB/Spo0J family partition protein [Candidatus Portnoybacteria bacterium]
MAKTLGRGLQSLIPKKQQKITDLASSRMQRAGWAKQKRESIFNVETDKIRPNPLQPRRDFAEKPLKELADSIREHGILQPLIVTKVEKTTKRGRKVEYELIAGERRWRAAQMAGLPSVPVVIRDSAARQKLEIALVENIQRENLNPIEMAIAFKQFQDDFGMKHHEIAEKVGRQRTSVTNFLRLLTLPQEVQDALSSGKTKEGRARALLLAEPSARLPLFREMMKHDWGVRVIEDKARKFAVPNKFATGHGPKNPFFKKIEKEVADNWGRRVSVTQRGEVGHMSIEFAGDKELKKLRDHLVKM